MKILLKALSLLTTSSLAMGQTVIAGELDEEWLRAEGRRIKDAERPTTEGAEKAVRLMEFVRITPGEFQMGSENGEADERPVHRVTLTEEFHMQTTEVTQAQWRAVMGNNPSNFKGDNRPVHLNRFFST